MDSWNPKQLSLMKTGGNTKCANYLKAKGIAPNTPIKAKYESDGAQLYKEVLKARVEGRPEPKELPKKAPSSGGFRSPAAVKAGEDPNGMERLSGETDQQYIARQTRLRDEAKARMRNKFGGGGMSSAGGGGGMSGIGSDPSYNPHSGYGGAADISVDSVVAGLGSAWNTFGTIANGAAQSAKSVISDEQTQRSLTNMGSSVANTSASIWSNFSSTVSSVAAGISQPDGGGDGLQDLQRQMASQRSASGAKYPGMGNGASFGSPASTLTEAQGLPGEDRNGIAALTGETDAQYAMRQTRLREEAKARMAAKFGGGGLSSASSSAPPSGGYTPKPPAPVPTKQSPPRQTRSAPTSGNWAGGGGTTPAKKMNATKMKVKVESSDDFFSSFGT